MLVYDIMADVVLVLHLCFILFVVFGSLLVHIWSWIIWLHIPSAAWGAIIQFAGWPCPLTPLEQYLRRLGRGPSYEGGFIDHYVGAIVYPEGIPRDVHILLGVGVVVINLAIYWPLLRDSRLAAAIRPGRVRRSPDHK
jgi:hypothetical protein